MTACLLAAFAACLSICSEHVEEARGGGAEAAVEEMCATHCAAPCPVTGTAAPLPVKPFALNYPPAEGARPEFVPASHEPPAVASSSELYPDALKPPDTPFERLRTLRI